MSKNALHTPGPWLSQQHGEDFICKGPNGERVFSIRNGVIPMNHDRRLIDGAPTMLEALYSAAALLNNQGLRGEVLDSVRSAIRKATIV